jgi:hypothetical protein
LAAHSLYFAQAAQWREGNDGPSGIAHRLGWKGNWVLGFDLNCFAFEIWMNLIHFDREILLNLFNKISDKQNTFVWKFSQHG